MSTIIADSLFKQLVAEVNESSLDTSSTYIAELRKSAFEKFKNQGFPTVKNEDWKYTNIHQLINKPYALDYTVEDIDIDVELAKIPQLDAYKLVTLNGKYITPIDETIKERGVTVTHMTEAYSNEAFVKNFSQHADSEGTSFVAINTALATSGLFIHVDKNTKLSKPIHLVHVAQGDQELFAQTRNLFVVEQGAEIEIIESFVSSDNTAEKLFNNVTEVSVAENGVVQHYYLQTADENARYISHTEVYQKKHSLYNNYNCNFPGASFVRHDINVRLDDEEVESHLYGINLTSESQFVDIHTIVDHLKPNCESYEWYKNITQDSSTAVFNGKIFVREDAQKTNAFQQNNNMLIGEKSAVYTKPQLEIFADDVKCSHGCTIGQFDDEALFYLRSRGIGEETARTVLVHAFAFDVTTRFSNEIVRKHVEKLVEKGLGL